MSFIKRSNLRNLNDNELRVKIKINILMNKIKTPMIIYSSINEITKYRGDDILEQKKLIPRIKKLMIFYQQLNKIYEIQKKVKQKYPDKEIEKIFLTKKFMLGFICK